jgi:Dullard-like phosphatase family protein
MSNKALIDSKAERTSYINNKTGKIININVVIRPYAIEMLKLIIRVNYLNEIIVFTAAIKNYGDAIINLLDPDKMLIDRCLYREHCIKVDSVHVKDFRTLNRDLSSVIIINNNITSFCEQIENGILVSSFSGAQTDTELGGLWIFLSQATPAEDVRIPITSKYNLKLLYQLYKRIKKH